MVSPAMYALSMSLVASVAVSQPSSALVENVTDTGLFVQMTADMGAYPGFTGSAPSGDVTVSAGYSYAPLTVYYKLTGMAPNTSGGLHIHVGTSCSDANTVGAHYWTPRSLTDPWNSNTMWMSDANGSAIGSFNVFGEEYIGNGYGYVGNLGHAVVIHAPNGTRIGCGVLNSTLNTEVAVGYDSNATNFTSCNVTTSLIANAVNFTTNHEVTSSQVRYEPTIQINGEAGKYYSVFVFSELVDLTDAPNHLHYGQYGNYITYAVMNIRGAGAMAPIIGDTIPYQSPIGGGPKAMAYYVYEQEGRLNFTTFLSTLIGNQASVPGTMGWVPARTNFYPADNAFRNGFTLVGINYAQIWFDKYSNYLLRSPTGYNMNSSEAPCLSVDATTIASRATMDGVLVSTSANMGPYPGTPPSIGAALNGTITLSASFAFAPLVIYYRLFNLEPNATGGLHIHSGTSCADQNSVGGHYWTPMTNIDPWMTTSWVSDANGNAVGSFRVDGTDYTGNGYGYTGNVGHAVVIHNSNGSRVGCGVLEDEISMVIQTTYNSPADFFSYCDANYSVGPAVASVYADGTSNANLTAAQARTEPVMSFMGEPGKYYAVLIVDLLVDSTNNPRYYYGEGGQYLHYAQANIPGEMAVTGINGLADIIPYQPPFGSANPKPVAIYLFEQPGMINATYMLTLLNLNPMGVLPGNVGFVTQRLQFDAAQYAFDLQFKMVGVNYFTLWADPFSEALLLSPTGYNLSSADILCPSVYLAQTVQNATDIDVSVSMQADMGAYPGYTGTAPSGNVTVSAGYSFSPLMLHYRLYGLEPNSSGGLHIHTGTSCADASTVGGHFWTPMSNTDPWLETYWHSDSNGSAIGYFVVEGSDYTGNGYGYQGNLGHAVVIHNSTGSRIGCGVLEDGIVTPVLTTFYSDATEFAVCGDNFTTTPGILNLDATAIGGARGNSITSGEARNEPTISFNGETGKYYAVLIVNILNSVTNDPQYQFGTGGQYLYYGQANIPGELAVTGINGLGDIIPYQPPFGANNPKPLVVYVYEQQSMVNASELLLQLYQNPTGALPGTVGFVPARLNFDASAFAFNNNFKMVGMNYAILWFDAYGLYEIRSPSIYNLTDIPCIEDDIMNISNSVTSYGVYVPMEAEIGRYPGSNISSPPSGTVLIWAASPDQPLIVYYNVTGLEPNTSGGIHIHEGTSCADPSSVGGHWWTPSTALDPWLTAMWQSDMNGTAVGNVTIDGSFYSGNGYGFASNIGHAVVLHNSTNSRIGCGVLDNMIDTPLLTTFFSPTSYFEVCGTNYTSPPGILSMNPEMFSVTSGDIRDEPNVSFWGESGKFYTVVMVDTMIDTTNNPNNLHYGEYGQYLNWAVMNIPGEEADTGIYGVGDIVPYQTPVISAAPRAVSIYVFEQPSYTNISTILMQLFDNAAGTVPGNIGFVPSRTNFHVIEFAAANNWKFMGVNMMWVFPSAYGLYDLESSTGYNYTAINTCPASFISQVVDNATSTGVMVPLYARMGQYPGSLQVPPGGNVVVEAATDSQALTVVYNLSGLPSGSAGGLHIHSGMTCNTSGGHYWNSNYYPVDPWTTNWVSNQDGVAQGEFTISTGYGYAANLGHAVVIHAPNGSRIGCGVLESTIDISLHVTYFASAIEFTSNCGNATGAPGVINLDPTSYGETYGNRLSVVQSRNPPVVSFEGDVTKNYTMLLIDDFSSALGPAAAGNWFHWGMVNIPGSIAATGAYGDGLAFYMPPANPNDAPHDYTFYLFEQNEYINASEAQVTLGLLNPPNYGRSNFDVGNFVFSYNLGSLKGINYATIFTDTYSNVILNGTGLEPPCPSALVQDEEANAIPWINVEVPEGIVSPAYLVWETPATSYDGCNTTKYFPWKVTSSMPSNGPTSTYMSTEDTTTPPTVFFQADLMKMYTVIFHDINGDYLHWTELNVPGYRARIGMYGSGDKIYGYFTPANPSPYPHQYAVTIFEQTGPIDPTTAITAFTSQSGVQEVQIPGVSNGAKGLAGVTNMVINSWAASISLGPAVAYNWGAVFNSQYSINIFNEQGLGRALGVMAACPAQTAAAVIANATAAGYVAPMYPSLSGLNEGLGVTFYPPQVSFSQGSYQIQVLPAGPITTINSGLPSPFDGTGNILAGSVIRTPPLVTAGFVDLMSNYSIVATMKKGDTTTAIWAVANVLGANVLTGNTMTAADTIIPFSYNNTACRTPPDCGQIAFWLVNQSTYVPQLNMSRENFNVTSFINTIGGNVIGFNFAKLSASDAGPQCLAADNVMVSNDGSRCIPDCGAQLRDRRACAACGTVDVSFSLDTSIASLNPTSFAASILSQIAAAADVAVTDLAVSVSPSGVVSVVLPASNGRSLNNTVNSGDLQLSYNGAVYRALPSSGIPSSTLTPPVNPLVPDAHGSDGLSGGAIFGIAFIVLILLLAVVYVSLRRFGVLEGKYCGVQLQPWDETKNGCFATCSNRATAKNAGNPYETGKGGSVENPTFNMGRPRLESNA